MIFITRGKQNLQVQCPAALYKWQPTTMQLHIWAYLGYTKLKPPQEEIITEYVLGKDVFVSLPTGFGKSICYGCLSDKLRGLDEKSIALIITPLISLMTDQMSSFTSKGLKAGFIGTGMNKRTVDAVMNGQYQLLFISPEALLESRRWRDILREEPYTSNLVAFAVDEAHCEKVVINVKYIFIRPLVVQVV